MENTLIKSVNKDFSKYEELLLRRDNLKKEAANIHLEYIRTFGDLIIESFKLKVECIRKKKMISYCQWHMNHGKTISYSALQDYISKEMESYENDLREIISDVKIAKEATAVSAAEARKIRSIYCQLVKKLHPDLHPDLFNDKTIREYWNRIVVAYTHSMLKDLEELEILVNIYLETNGIDTSGIDIRNIDEKIMAVEAEIEDIISNDPYQYRFILADEEECKSRKNSYENEIKSYREYSVQLDEILATFKIERVLS